MSRAETIQGAICGGYNFERRAIQFCPTEGRRRRMIGQFAHWYGFTWTCLGCGDRWQDGERGSRPFARGWRQQRIARAKAGWDRVTLNARDNRAAFEEMLRAYFEEPA